jgi:hypothetical protein
MLSNLFFAWALMAACVVCHAVGITLAARRLRRQRVRAPRFWRWTWLFVQLAGWMVVLHLVEIAAWAQFFIWMGALPDVSSALYFSAVTYTTTGYGDIVLSDEWRLVGAVESLTGILMCGWSTAFFFAVVSRIFELKSRRPQSYAEHRQSRQPGAERRQIRQSHAR